jgi:hypothetical protein
MLKVGYNTNNNNYQNANIANRNSQVFCNLNKRSENESQRCQNHLQSLRHSHFPHHAHQQNALRSSFSLSNKSHSQFHLSSHQIHQNNQNGHSHTYQRVHRQPYNTQLHNQHHQQAHRHVLQSFNHYNHVHPHQINNNSFSDFRSNLLPQVIQLPTFKMPLQAKK